MTRITFLALLLCTTAVFVSCQDYSNVNIAFDYATIDIAKMTLLKPLVEEKLKNLDIPANITNKVGTVNIFISHLKLLSANADWANSKLSPGNNGYPSLVIRGLDVHAQFDCEVKFGVIHERASGNTVNVTLDIEVDLGFEKSTPGNTTVFFSKSNFPVKKVDLHLNGALGKIQRLLFKAIGVSLEKAAEKIITDKIKDLNETLVTNTSKPLVFDLEPVELHATLFDLPQLANPEHTHVDNKILTFNLSVTGYKNNERYNPFAEKDETLPAYIHNLDPLQATISEEVVQVALWAIFQNQTFTGELSAKDLPPEAKLKFKTDDLVDVFPNIVNEFGANKGVYLKISRGGEYPQATIVDGKLSGEFPIQLDFVVDQDSSKYPLPGLKNYTTVDNTCKVAASLNTTVSGAAVVFKVDNMHFGLNYSNISISNVRVLSGTVDESKITQSLNDDITDLMKIVDELIKDEKGVKNPLFGKYGINDTNAVSNKSYISAGMDFALPTEPTKLKFLEY